MKTLDLKNAKAFWGLSVFLFVALIGVDQLIKTLATNIFYNSNFAFSLPLPVWLMYLIYAGVLSAIVCYYAKYYNEFNLFSRLAWILILAGAVSNIIERIFLGSVRDFIYITFFNRTGIYNLADGFIILGILILLFKSYNHHQK